MAIYEKHTYKSPALPFIYHKDCIKKRTHGYLSSNWHENIEVLSFISGSGTVRIDGKEHAASTGDVFVINANCLHEFSSDTEMIYRVLIIDRAFFVSNYINIDSLHFSTRFRDSKISLALERIAELYTDEKKSEWRELLIRSEVLCIVAALCERHSELYDKGREHDASILLAVKRAIGHIHTEYQHELSLEDICSVVGLSKYYFAREFHRITGYSIVNYINLTRCENAKLMLTETSATIMQIAQNCGFSDQSYFTRAFRKNVGLTPTEYRRQGTAKIENENVAQREGSSPYTNSITSRHEHYDDECCPYDSQ